MDFIVFLGFRRRIAVDVLLGCDQDYWKESMNRPLFIKIAKSALRWNASNDDGH
jgi:hypothetical protein